MAEAAVEVQLLDEPVARPVYEPAEEPRVHAQAEQPTQPQELEVVIFGLLLIRFRNFHVFRIL